MRDRYPTWDDIEKRAGYLDSYLLTSLQSARSRDREELEELERQRDAARAKDVAEIARLNSRIHLLIYALRCTPCTSTSHVDCTDAPREQWCRRCATLFEEEDTHE